MIQARQLDLGFGGGQSVTVSRQLLYAVAMDVWNSVYDSSEGFYMNPSRLLEVCATTAQKEGFKVEENLVADVLFQGSNTDNFDRMLLTLKRVFPEVNSDDEIYKRLYACIRNAIMDAL